MKKYIYILITFLTNVAAAQTADTLFHEDFESGGNTFSLNTADMNGSQGSSGYNEWIINNAYTGGSGQLVCLGIPTTFTVASTQSQPVSITGGPNTFYMHMISDAAVAAGINNCSYLAANGLCGADEYYFSAMNQDVNVAIYDSVTVSFIWLCDGSQNIYGELYYSTDSGTSWTLVSGATPKYRNQPTWANQSVTLPVTAAMNTFRIGFRFVNQVSLSANDPGFGIDEIVITGKSAAVAPVVAFSVSDSAFCEGTCIDFADLSTGNPTSWFWVFSGATPSFSTAQNPSQICYSQPGSYPVSLIVNGAGGSDTLTFNDVVVYTQPGQPVITNSGDTLFATTGFTSYQWYLNGVAISGATTESYLTTVNGTYEVTATDSNGCSATSLPVNITTSLSELQEEISLIYPNPVKDFLFVLPANENGELKFYDATGRKLSSVKLQQGVTSRIDLRNLPAGIYLTVQQYTSGKSIVKKIVKF